MKRTWVLLAVLAAFGGTACGGDEGSRRSRSAASDDDDDAPRPKKKKKQTAEDDDDTRPARRPTSNANDDTETEFQDGVAKIRRIVPGWDNGSGLALKFRNPDNNKGLVILYVDTTPPEFKKDPGFWMIQGQAKEGNKIIANYVILLKDLEPGHYTGNATRKDVVMASSIGDSWQPKAPNTSWSINTGGNCEITLRRGKGSGELEGEFSGKLVDNDEKKSLTVEKGFIYIKQ